MSRPLWFIKIIKFTFPGVKFFARMTRIPLIGKFIDYLLFKDDDIIYLPQSKVVEINKSFIGLGSYLLPSQIIEHFIEKANYLWIMNYCICRSSLKCNDYPIDYGCLFLGEATLNINPVIGRHVSKEEALKHIEKCDEAGLVHLIGRNKLDRQWLGAGPGDKLMTICNCCPCCCLWRIAPLLEKKISRKLVKMPGVEIKIADSCIGCGTCTENICFVNAIHIENGRAVINRECRGCGRCSTVCPEKAITVTVFDNTAIQDVIKRLEKKVDVM